MDYLQKTYQRIQAASIDKIIAKHPYRSDSTMTSEEYVDWVIKRSDARITKGLEDMQKKKDSKQEIMNNYYLKYIYLLIMENAELRLFMNEIQRKLLKIRIS